MYTWLDTRAFRVMEWCICYNIILQREVSQHTFYTLCSASEDKYIGFSNLIYPLGTVQSVCNFDVKYCRISSNIKGEVVCQDKSGVPSVRKGAIRFVQVSLILPRPIFLSFRRFRRQLVHNIQNDPRSLIAIYKVPVVRISPLNSARIHFELHTFGSSVFGYVFFFPFFACGNMQSPARYSKITTFVKAAGKSRLIAVQTRVLTEVLLN